MSKNPEWAFVSTSPLQDNHRARAPSEDSDITEKDIPPHLECVSCQGRHQVTVAFKECKSTHATCTRCLKGIFRAKWEYTLHGLYLPTSITCPLCRVGVENIGVISQGLVSGEAVVVGGEDFIVAEWQPLLRWMVNEEMDVGLGLRMYHLAKKYHLAVRRTETGWKVPERQVSSPELSVDEIEALMVIYQSGGE